MRRGAAVLRGAGLLAAAGGSEPVNASPAPIASDRAKSPGERGRYPWPQRVIAARRFARHRIGTVSFAIVGERGNLRGYKPQRRFHSASVVKAMLMVSYLRRPSVRHRPLNARDRSLLHPMITRSDNGTATAIYDIVGNAG